MRPIIAIAIILFAFVSITYRFYNVHYTDTTTAVTEPYHPSDETPHSTTPSPITSEDGKHDFDPSHSSEPPSKLPPLKPPPSKPSPSKAPQEDSLSDWDPTITHHEVFSVSTADKKFFRIDFGQQLGINPNLIPHPIYNDTWIAVAQLHNQRAVPNSYFFTQIVCNVVFKDGKLVCNSPTSILPIAATTGPKENCGDANKVPVFFGLSIGPHDARIFYGPERPFAMYGSISKYTCFGQWMLDFRILVDWGMELSMMNEEILFREATEVVRPPPFGVIEKNWFVFWDSNDNMYIHMDIAPKRAFAKLDNNGTTGEDLAPLAASKDEKCINEFMPKAPRASEHLEDIHQATNSLKITLCVRSDPACKPDDTNTFIMTLFHHKTFFSWHGVYDPFVMLFKQSAPFEIHGISQKPIWFHGRGGPGKGRKPDVLPEELHASWNQTEMFFTTSISWKQKGQKYHGYIDDVMFVGFGIEDRDTGGIDVVAGDLLGGMALCQSLFD